MAELLDRTKIEESFSRKLGALAGRHRRKLRELLGDPPDPLRVPASFWQKVQRETEEELAAMLLLIYVAASTQHGMDEDRAVILSSQFVSGRAAETAERYTERSVRLVTQGASGGQTPTEIVNRVFSPERVANIAITETTVARSQGITSAAKDDQTETIGEGGERIPADQSAVLVWELEVKRKVESHCLFCPMVAGTASEYWERFYESGPACHVRCACGILVYPPGTPTRTKFWSDGQVLMAAKQSGVFGY